MSKEARDRAKKVKLLISDVDGVFTDCSVALTSGGEEIKAFDIQDGYGVTLAQKAGLDLAVISARYSKITELRCKELKIKTVLQVKVKDTKINAYRKILKKYNVRNQEVAYIGDDLLDLCILRKVGFAATVPNAVEEVKNISHFVTSKPGGKGALRELIEFILKSQNKWQKVLKEH
jgi:3-deoxy-D-manno-octulosonate 8-phosphate phosphatase (KDO 8-P phosphatase)